jgi:hypothetical protein
MRQPPTTTDEEPQRHRDHRDTPNYLVGNRLCFVLRALCASVVRKGTLRRTNPIGATGGRDWGLPIGDSRVAGGRCGQNAKQTQSTTYGYIALSFCRTQGIDTRYQIRDTRPPCGRRAKQSQSATSGCNAGESGRIRRLGPARAGRGTRGFRLPRVPWAG